MAERRLPKPKVAGSTPVARFRKSLEFRTFGLVAPFGTGGSCPKYVPGSARVSEFRDVSGHVFRVERKREGWVWYAKYRLRDGRQVQKKVGPAWTQRGRPASGFFTKRTAEDWLRELLDQVRAGTLPGMVRTNATVADACAEWLRYSAEERGCSPGTMRGRRAEVRAHFLPAFGDRPLEDVTAGEIERWRSGLPDRLSVRTKNKLLTSLGGIFKRAKKVWGLPVNPVLEVEHLRERPRVDFEVYSPEEVLALVRFAASEQDAAIYLTAAFTGLRRGELIALRWRDVDFGGSVIRVRRAYSYGALTVPKSGKARAVPLAPEVARSLARLGARSLWTGEEDLVFPARLAAFSTGRRCAVATPLPSSSPESSSCGFTTCATRSGRG